jgi:hypothetical protein
MLNKNQIRDVNGVNFIFGASQSSEFFALQKRGEAF